MVIYIVQIFHCFFIFKLNKWLIPLALIGLLIWKYKGFIKIVWRHKVQKIK